MTKVQHVRWCITQCPAFAAEHTIWWFLSGKKDWCVYEAMEKYNYIRKQING